MDHVVTGIFFNYIKGTKLSQQILIGGSIGPYGACLCDRSEYHGNYIDTINLEVIIT